MRDLTLESIMQLAAQCATLPLSYYTCTPIPEGTSKLHLWLPTDLLLAGTNQGQR